MNTYRKASKHRKKPKVINCRDKGYDVNIDFFYTLFCRVHPFSVYLLQLFGDSKAGVNPFSPLCVFGFIVFQKIASGELSSYKPYQRQVYIQKDRKKGVLMNITTIKCL